MPHCPCWLHRLLTNEPIILHNIPQIQDTHVMRNLIESLGVQIEDLDDDILARHRA